MVQSVAESITSLLLRKEIILEEDSEIYEYGFVSILHALIEILLVVAAGIVLNCLMQIVFSMLCVFVLRTHIGGWHANRALLCYTCTTSFMVASVYLGRYAPDWMPFLLLAVSVALVVALAPVVHFNNPKTQEEIIAARRKALIVTAVITAILLLMAVSPLQELAFCGCFAVFFSAISLVIPIVEPEDAFTDVN